MTDGCHLGMNSITGRHNAVKCVSEAEIDHSWTLTKAVTILPLAEPSLSHYAAQRGCHF